jgi:hypothetical protein
MVSDWSIRLGAPPEKGDELAPYSLRSCAVTRDRMGGLRQATVRRTTGHCQPPSTAYTTMACSRAASVPRTSRERLSCSIRPLRKPRPAMNRSVAASIRRPSQQRTLALRQQVAWAVFSKPRPTFRPIKAFTTSHRPTYVSGDAGGPDRQGHGGHGMAIGAGASRGAGEGAAAWRLRVAVSIRRSV